MKKSIVTICSSANFYQKVVDIQAQLEKAGFRALIPLTAEKMKASGNFDAAHYRTWLKDSEQYHKKSALMRGHFDEIEKGDTILIVNEEKHGIRNYIGGNVLMEMALAFYLKKPIYILNGIPEESPFLEEIIGMEPIVLNGSVDELIDQLGPKASNKASK